MSSCTCTCPVISGAAPSAPIYKNECALCFRDPKLLDFCFKCLEAFCPVDLPAHHAKHPSHVQFLTISRAEVEEDSAPSPAPASQNYSIVIPASPEKPEAPQCFSFKCTSCAIEDLTDFSSLPAELVQQCQLIIQSPDASIKTASSTDAWTEASAQVCEHSLCLEQDLCPTGKFIDA
jgi:hypothetical protein